jgi:ABC-2 type transport system permease protein
MRGTFVIFKRELGVYFRSPIAYVVLFVFILIAGWFFYNSVAMFVLQTMFQARNPFAEGLNATDMVISPMFLNMAIVLLMMLPLLTMRLFAEEKKTGTFELLFSYPIRDVEVLMGKFLAALTVFLVMIALSAVHPLHLYLLGVGELKVAAAGYLGLAMMGASFIALGVFVSSLTENQIIAAAVSFGLSLFVWVLYWAVQVAQPPLSHVLEYLSLVTHLANFARGIIDTADVAYYLLFIFFFLFLTLRSLESKRWRG